MRQPAIRGAPAPVLTVLFSLWVLTVVLIGQPNYMGAGFGRSLGAHLAYAVLFAVSALALWRRRSLPDSTPLDPAVLLVLATLAVSVAGSINRSISTEAVLISAAPVLAFVSIQLLPLSRNMLVTSLLGVGVVMACFVLIREATLYLRWLELAAAVDGGFRSGHLVPPAMPRSGGLMHPNDQAVLLNLVLPFAVLMAWQQRRWQMRLLSSVLAIFLAAALVATFTRGAWLGTGVGFGIFVVLAVLGRRSEVRNEFRFPVLRAALAGFVLVAVVAVSAVMAWDSRPQWLFRDTLSYRADAARVALEIIEDRPIFGSGANSYGLLYESEDGLYPEDNVHPHNAYLSVLVDSGIVGGLLLLGALLVTAAWFLKTFMAAYAADRTVLAACAAAATTLLVHGLMLSPQLFSPALLFVAIIAVIALRSAPNELPGRATPFSRQARFTVVGLVPLLVAGWLAVDLPHARYRDGVTALAVGDLPEAFSAAETTDGPVLSPASSFLLAMTEGLYYQQSGNQHDLHLAMESFYKAVDAEPNSAYAHANLAMLLVDAGANRAANNHASLAVTAAPRNLRVLAVSGAVFEATGDRAQAADAYGRAIKIEPAFSQASYWLASDGRRALREEAIVSAGAMPCALGKAAVLYGQIADDLVRLTEECYQERDSSSGLLLMLFSLGRQQELLTEAARIESTMPSTAGRHFADGLEAAYRGDVAGARHGLMIASYMGMHEATWLLAATYGGTGGSNQLSPLLTLPSHGTPLPQAVQRRLPHFPALNTVFGSIENDHAAEIYFRIDLQREAPAVVLLPGGWQELVMPFDPGVRGAASRP